MGYSVTVVSASISLVSSFSVSEGSPVSVKWSNLVSKLFVPAKSVHGHPFSARVVNSVYPSCSGPSEGGWASLALSVMAGSAGDSFARAVYLVAAVPP